MKLQELKEKKALRTILGDVNVHSETTELNYYKTIVLGHFKCSYTKIKSLKGSPIKVREFFTCSNTDITSLEGCPRDVGDTFYLLRTRITSLHNIHKYIDRIGDTINISPTIESHLLGVLKIRDLRAILTETGPTSLGPALEIINKYLKDKPIPSSRDIHKCQEEMIEAGLEAYARL